MARVGWTMAALALALVPVLAGCSQAPTPPAADDPPTSQEAELLLGGVRRLSARTDDDEMLPFLEALVTAGVDLHEVPTLEGNASSAAVVTASPMQATSLARLAQVRAVAGLPLVDVAGQPLADRLLALRDNGTFGTPADDAHAVRALGLAGTQAPDVVARLAESQGADGGWSWTREPQVASAAELTGLVLTALVEAQALHAPSAEHAADFLLQSQQPGGGWASAGGGPSNCLATVWAIEGLASAGRNIPASAWAFLRTLIRPDGTVAYSAGHGSNPSCTGLVAATWARHAT